MSKSFNDRLTIFWRDRYADPDGRCRLCGGTCFIHDRKRDIRLPCLCPNARATYDAGVPTLADAMRAFPSVAAIISEDVAVRVDDMGQPVKPVFNPLRAFEDAATRMAQTAGYVNVKNPDDTITYGVVRRGDSIVPPKEN